MYYLACYNHGKKEESDFLTVIQPIMTVHRSDALTTELLEDSWIIFTIARISNVENEYSRAGI